MLEDNQSQTDTVTKEIETLAREKTAMLLDLIASVIRDNPELLFYGSKEIGQIASVVEATGRTVFNGT